MVRPHRQVGAVDRSATRGRPPHPVRASDGRCLRPIEGRDAAGDHALQSRRCVRSPAVHRIAPNQSAVTSCDLRYAPPSLGVHCRAQQGEDGRRCLGPRRTSDSIEARAHSERSVDGRLTPHRCLPRANCGLRRFRGLRHLARWHARVTRPLRRSACHVRRRRRGSNLRHLAVMTDQGGRFGPLDWVDPGAVDGRRA